MKRVTKQVESVDRIFKAMRAVQTNPASQPGQHSGCWSEAITPSDAATNRPANGARCRSDHRLVDFESASRQHNNIMFYRMQVAQNISPAKTTSNPSFRELRRSSPTTVCGSCQSTPAPGSWSFAYNVNRSRSRARSAKVCGNSSRAA